MPQILAQSSAGVVLAGQATAHGYGDFAAARVNESGHLDPAFNNRGTLALDLGGHAVAPRLRWRLTARS